jgi:hypothetical protein
MANYWQANSGMGYNSYTQNVLQPFGQFSNHGSTYNNGNGRLNFNVSSYIPVNGNGEFSTKEKVKEFATNEFNPVLTALGRAGAFDVPFHGLGEFLFDVNRNPIPDGFANAWGNYFASPFNFGFPPAYGTFIG